MNGVLTLDIPFDQLFQVVCRIRELMMLLLLMPLFQDKHNTAFPYKNRFLSKTALEAIDQENRFGFQNLKEIPCS